MVGYASQTKKQNTQAFRMDGQSDFVFKIVIIGSNNVGKTCISDRFNSGIFNKKPPVTIAADVQVKMITIDNQTVKLHIWDTAGTERYRSVPTTYYRSADAVVLVYDVTNRKSFTELLYWLNEVKSHVIHEALQIVLVANKIDSEVEKQEVSRENGEEFAKKNGMFFLETSAVTGHNIDHLFFQLARNLKELKLMSLHGDHLQGQGEGKHAVQLPSDNEQQQQMGWRAWCCGGTVHAADNVAGPQLSPTYTHRSAPASGKRVQLATATLSMDVNGSSSHYFSSPFESQQLSFLNHYAIVQGTASPSLASEWRWGVQTDDSCGTSSFILLETKNLAAVQRELLEFNNWFDLGLQLGLLYHTLKRIEQEQHYSIVDCKREMLAAWLRQEDNVMQEGGPSWPQLAKSLESLKCHRLAQKIRKSHFS